MNNKLMISDDTYRFENGRVFDKFKKKVVPMNQLFEQKDFKLLKYAFISAEQFYHAYVLDELDNFFSDSEKDIDLEFLFDSIIKLQLSGKCEGTTVTDLIEEYINDPEEYTESYNASIGNFLNYIGEVA